MIIPEDMFRTTNPYDELISKCPQLYLREKGRRRVELELTPLPFGRSPPSSSSLLLPHSSFALGVLTVKATDEKLTSEDWGLNLELCDKVTEDKEAG